MKMKLAMLFAAAFAALSLGAAEAAAPAAETKADAKAEAKAPAKKAAAKKPAAKKPAAKMPADGGLKNSTTATPRQDPTKVSGWTKRYAAKAKQLAADKNEVDIVFIGDSITHFWEYDSKTQKRKIGGLDTYKKYFSNYKVLNLGYSGDRTQHALWIASQSPCLNNIKPKMVSVMIGTNNIGHKTAGPAATAAGIKLVVESLRKKLPETRILLFGVFPRGAKPDNPFRKQISEINSTICQLADAKNVFYCDITLKLLEKDGTLSKNIMPDYLHPGEAGYEIWAQAIMPYVQKFVDKK